mmetsp:Transcript_2823/g.8318  ORF Transcript_2823/g.8318 Transcript_2823/m.8318 type:complete len:280 (+) Transcript_2823:896-1735(+)
MGLAAIPRVRRLLPMSPCCAGAGKVEQSLLQVLRRGVGHCEGPDDPQRCTRQRDAPQTHAHIQRVSPGGVRRVVHKRISKARDVSNDIQDAMRDEPTLSGRENDAEEDAYQDYGQGHDDKHCEEEAHSCAHASGVRLCLSNRNAFEAGDNGRCEAQAANAAENGAYDAEGPECYDHIGCDASRGGRYDVCQGIAEPCQVRNDIENSSPKGPAFHGRKKSPKCTRKQKGCGRGDDNTEKKERTKLFQQRQLAMFGPRWCPRGIPPLVAHKRSGFLVVNHA